MAGSRSVNQTMQRLGGTRIGIWLIRHVVSPLDKWLYRRTGGRRLSLGKPLAPTLLLTTTGRRTGQPRTIPVFYLQDGERLILCNVNPGFERPNPWTLNLLAHPIAQVQIGARTGTYHARQATDAEITQYWSRLVNLWSAYERHYQASGQRTLFVLTPVPDASAAEPPG